MNDLETSEIINVKSFTLKYILKDDDIYFLTVSSQMYAFFGTEPSYYKNGFINYIKNNFDIELANKIRNVFYDANVIGKNFRYTYKLKKSGGHPCWIQNDAYFEKKTDEGYVYNVIVNDVSDRIISQEKLKEASTHIVQQGAFLDRLYKTLPIAVMQCDANPDPIIINGNPASFELLGIRESDIHQPGGIHVFSTVYPADVSIVQACNHDLAVKGINGDTVHYEHRIVTPAGEIKWLSVISQFIYNEKNEPVFTVMMENITEIRKLRDRERHESAIERQALIDAIHSAYNLIMLINISKDKFKVIDSKNYNYPLNDGESYDEEIIRTGASITKEFREEQQSKLRRQPLLEAANSGKKEVRIEGRKVFDDGSVHWVESRDLLTKDAITGDFIAVALVRITDDWHEQNEKYQRELRDALTKAEAANVAKTDFLARMSHDIRTPLNGIIGMTGLAKDVNKDKAVGNYLEKISESGDFLLNLINDILDMNKVESGKLILRPEPYTFIDFKRYISAIIVPLCEKNGLNFKIEGKINSQTIFVDKVRFNQIFFNLLSNAVKYTPRGGHIVFEVKQNYVHDNQIFMELNIKDDGIGMSEEFQKKLFLPFEQEFTERNANRNGSGLGLSITKRLLDLMNGKISVKSKLGEGSVFNVQIDIPLVDSSISTVETDIDISILNGKHFLIVEDNSINAEITSKLLQKVNAKAIVATNGEDAIKILMNSKNVDFDAILMDVRMPIMDGIETTKRIKCINREDVKKIPIIALTANAYSEDVRECLDCGMVEHISKPIDPAIMYKKIAKWVSN